jgi:hypothetical protein
VSNLTTILVLSAGADGNITLKLPAETSQDINSLGCAV